MYLHSKFVVPDNHSGSSSIYLQRIYLHETGVRPIKYTSIYVVTLSTHLHANLLHITIADDQINDYYSISYHRHLYIRYKQTKIKHVLPYKSSECVSRVRLSIINNKEKKKNKSTISSMRNQFHVICWIEAHSSILSSFTPTLFILVL